MIVELESYIDAYMPLFCSCVKAQPCIVCVIKFDHGVTFSYTNFLTMANQVEYNS